ncbi:hypothetical protein LTR41_011247 [Exophiala xenobiotica]|nr:hypothetical protein LTR41_011247 [Exophiala xenobiotica]KAK5550924.1 hypothetical protein LTR46_011067 [Exophiala xenobiotica]
MTHASSSLGASPAQPEQRLKNHFSIWSIISLAFTTTNSWMAFSSSLGVPLAAGGGPVAIYGLVCAAIVLGTVGTGLAEMASAFPTAGGQYHYIYMLWSPMYRNAGAYTAAWMTITAWSTAVTSSCIFIANSAFSIATIYNPDFVAKAWQVYLVHVALSTSVTYIVARHPRGVGLLSMGFFWVTLSGFLASVIAVLIRSPTKQPASFVFSEFVASTGWSDGFSFFIGSATCLWAFAGLDGATHVSEEVPNPTRNVPIAIGCTIMAGVLTVIPWSLTIMFSISDPSAIVVSSVPILEIYRQCLNSTIGTTVFMVYFMVVFYIISLNCALFASRLLWSLASDGGIPFSKYFSETRDGNPERPAYIVYFLQILFGLLYIASTVAFNSLIGISILANNITFVAPQAALVIRGRHHLRPGYFRLGKFGYVVNSLATLFIAFFTVVLCFPVYVPVTSITMNYTPVCLGLVVMLVVLFWWCGVRHTFKGPSILLEGQTGSEVTSQSPDNYDCVYSFKKQGSK